MKKKKQNSKRYLYNGARIKYHIVLVTKFRLQIFNEGKFEYFEGKLKEIGKYYLVIEIETKNHERAMYTCYFQYRQFVSLQVM
ncbi:MAG: hypothetical protein A2452_06450 [Candidatus Firestonebacteria bacterium RIFOXYC2_FULL_39_67]|nr:MAG: hypothetical protein A2452_06450 [Candidatus Firestonebacteria bacterium RIFOXYC2_FULL_39_67]